MYLLKFFIVKNLNMSQKKDLTLYKDLRETFGIQLVVCCH